MTCITKKAMEMIVARINGESLSVFETHDKYFEGTKDTMVFKGKWSPELIACGKDAYMAINSGHAALMVEAFQGSQPNICIKVTCPDCIKIMKSKGI